MSMDQSKCHTMGRIGVGEPLRKVHLLRDYAGRTVQEVADPWYTGDFEIAWQDILQGCQGLLKELLTEK